MSARLSRAAVASVFARSFLIQASWNYHTMLGSGFAFAILPGLKSLFGDDPERMDASVRRHLEHFNAHPYLSGLALGATLRLEADGKDPEAVRRFKSAVRGPLGGLGDSLVWSAWLPVVAILSLSSYWLGAPGWVVIVVFLLLYNVGHLGLRAWGFRMGLAEGQGVGQRLGQTNLTAWTERLRRVAALLLGLLGGAVLSGTGGLADSGVFWGVFAVAGFLAGLFVGHRVWRPTAVAVVGAIALISTWGFLR